MGTYKRTIIDGKILLPEYILVRNAAQRVIMDCIGRESGIIWGISLDRDYLVSFNWHIGNFV